MSGRDEEGLVPLLRFLIRYSTKVQLLNNLYVKSFPSEQMLWENCYLLCRREKNSQMLLGRRVTLNFEANTNFKKNVTAFILRVILLLFI